MTQFVTTFDFATSIKLVFGRYERPTTGHNAGYVEILPGQVWNANPAKSLIVTRMRGRKNLTPVLLFYCAVLFLTTILFSPVGLVFIVYLLVFSPAQAQPRFIVEASYG